MSRDIPYEKQTLQHPNPIVRFAHRARYRNSLRVVSRLAPTRGLILDFGAGEGEFLHRLGSDRPDVRLAAVEPYMHLKYAGIVSHGSMDAVGDGTVDVLCAFETLEHVSGDELESFIAHANRVCRPTARIVISVPIMQGLALPVKEISRSVLFRRMSDYRPLELARGTLGMTVRRADNVLLSHRGFDHRILCERLKAEFAMLERFCSPFRALPWWSNSQSFFVCAPRPIGRMGSAGRRDR
jgi:hypothetical protein